MDSKLYTFKYALVLFLIFASPVLYSQCRTLVWSDEFNGTSLDASNWSYDVGNGCDNSAGCWWGNNEKEYYTNGSNVTVTGGNLVITPKYEPNYNNSGLDYTSARIITLGKQSWKYVITLNSTIVISDDITLDGTTQAGYDINNPSPMIELSSAPTILIITGGSVGSEIKGLAITNSPQIGIYIENTSNIKIQGCYVGLDLDGNAAGNAQPGIKLLNASNNQIGGNSLQERNIISGNQGDGIAFENSTNNKVIGNYIGTDILGIGSIGNGIGVNLYTNSTNNQIGGIADSMNVISGNNATGVHIIDGSSQNLIIGNIIGLDKNGQYKLGNAEHGIYLDNSPDCIIGGNRSTQRNVISGNLSIGINMYLCPRTIVKGNYIGTSLDGTLNLGNSIHGVQIQNSREVIIGGSNDNYEGNIISGHIFHGINLDPNCNKAIIKGNYIGTDVSGKFAISNKVVGMVIKSDSLIVGGIKPSEGNLVAASGIAGILLANANYNTVTGNLVGTTSDTTSLPNNGDGINISVEDPGQMAVHNIVKYNVIAYNHGNGVSVGKALDPTRIYQGEDYNTIRFNSIYCNKLKGINLDLSSSNDCGNQCQPAPVINSLKSNSSKLTGIPVTGVNNTGLIDIYQMIDCPDCKVNPQGKKYITTITPNADGSWTYDNGSSIQGVMVAVYTNKDSSTSEFSTCYTPCSATANGTISESIVDLNQTPEKTINLVSTSNGDSQSPLPLNTYWILNTNDTSSAFSNSDSTTIVFGRHKGLNIIGPGADTLYLIVKQGGCMDTLSFPIMAFFIPNLITPNGDNKNDSWEVSARPDLFEAKIYNRWGELIFSKDGYTNDWDLTSVNDGVYFYYLNDKTGTGNSYKGWVQVVR